MANLYEIDNQILECVDLETGEIIDQEKLNSLELERDKKIESIALWYKNCKADEEAYKKEKNIFAEKEKTSKNKAESLKNFLANYLGESKFKTSKVSISFRNSESVEIVDADSIDDNYLNYKEPEPDKTKIKEALKQGVSILGAILKVNNNIQIK